MARNSQIWSQDQHLLLNGPNATRKEMDAAIESINQGGLFGYRFQYPPMCLGSSQLYWHRPLIATLSPDREKPIILPDTLLGYLTAYDIKHLDLDHPSELWPRLYKRSTPMALIELFRDRKHEQKNRNESSESVGSSRTSRPWKAFSFFCKADIDAAENRTLDAWLASLPELAGHKKRVK